MAQASPTAPAAPAPPHRAERGLAASTVIRSIVQRREATVVAVTLGVIIYFGIASSAFFTTANIVTIAQYIASIAVIGAGEVLILVLAEIDLSAGQVYLTSPWFMYLLWHAGMALGWAIALTLVLCIIIGLINGVVTVWLNVPSLIVTLGMTYALFGLVLVESNAIQVNTPGATGLFGWAFGIGSWSTILWALGILIIGWIILKRTRFGLHITATGGNLLGAAEAGVPVRRIKVYCFMIISLASGFIGILDAIRIQSMNPGNTGLDIVLPGIVAAVVGGTALTGGRGTIVGTAIGAIFLGVLEDGFNLIGVSANWFYLAEGVVILIAMVANTQLTSLAARLRR